MLLVVYFDTFYKELIKRLHEHNIEFELVKYNNINLDKTYDKVIITGSKKRILRENQFPLLEQLVRRKNVNIIGICFGFQYLALMSGGQLAEGKQFVGYRDNDNMYFNHYDRVVKLPQSLWTIVSRVDEFINIAATPQWVGFQFHPEKRRETFDHYLLPFIVAV
jgi:GMP synthase-like glutamine amidotransferase